MKMLISKKKALQNGESSEHISSQLSNKQANKNSSTSESQIQTKNYLNQLLKSHKKPIYLALLVAMTSMLLFVLQSYLLAQIFADWLVAISSKHTPTLQLAKHYLPILAVVLCVRPLLGFYKNHILIQLSLTIRQQVRSQLLSAIVRLGATRHYYGSDGSLSNKVLEQVDQLDGFISRFYIQKYIAVLTPIIIIIATAYYSVLAAVLMFITAPLVPIFMILVGSAAANKSREQFQAMAQLSGRFLDLLRGMPTLKRLQATEQAGHAIQQSSEQYQQRTMQVLKLAFLSGGVLELFSSLAIALVALYLGLGLLGILPWAKGTIPVAYEGALFILLLAPEFYAPLRQLGSDYHAKANAEGAVAEFYPLLQASNALDNTPSTTEPQNEQESNKPQNELQLNKLLDTAPSLDLFHVSISTDEHRVRLAPTSLHLEAKQKVAISGVSGIGKSSLLQAILGFVAFDGEIQLQHQQLEQNELVTLQHRIGYLAQTSSLLPMTIAENLRLAKKQATDAELKQVLEQVDLWSLVSQLPQGINTLLGERGKGLSGGQQQRLAIAQLLLRESPLWLLDEPCSHLDPETATQIFHLLGQLSHDKTVLLISHELEHIDWLDKVVTLNADNSAHNSTYKTTEEKVQEVAHAK